MKEYRLVVSENSLDLIISALSAFNDNGKQSERCRLLVKQFNCLKLFHANLDEVENLSKKLDPKE